MSSYPLVGRVSLVRLVDCCLPTPSGWCGPDGTLTIQARVGGYLNEIMRRARPPKVKHRAALTARRGNDQCAVCVHTAYGFIVYVYMRYESVIAALFCPDNRRCGTTVVIL